MAKTENELSVITKAKDLCGYIMTITQRSPKHFRFTFVSRLQNLALDVVERMYLANDCFISASDLKRAERRLEFQYQALTDLKLLAYIALLSLEQKCILPKQYEEIARRCSESRNMLGAWIKSDQKRLRP